MDPDALQLELMSNLQVMQRVRYVSLASGAFVLYDHILTISSEYNLVWKAHWSKGKCLFLINRYYMLIAVLFNNYALFNPNPSDAFCLNWYRWQGWTGVVFFVVAEMILQLRLYALYCLNKRILVFMTVVCVAAAASSAAVMGFALSNATVTTSHIFPQKSFCVIFGMSDYFFAFWIPMLISEVVLCAFAIFRAFETIRPGSTLFSSGGQIVEILIRDAILYFIFMLIAYVCEAIVFAVGQTNEVEIPITVASTISCVLTNRMCLNVRGMLQGESMAPYPVPLDSPGFEEELYSPVVYTVDGSALSAREMYELRSLRANRVSPVCFEHAGTMKPFFGGFSRRSGV